MYTVYSIVIRFVLLNWEYRKKRLTSLDTYCELEVADTSAERLDFMCNLAFELVCQWHLNINMFIFMFSFLVILNFYILVYICIML